MISNKKDKKRNKNKKLSIKTLPLKPKIKTKIMKYLVLAAGLFLSIQANAQEKTSLETSSQDFNRWTIEAMTGFSDGNYP